MEEKQEVLRAEMLELAEAAQPQDVCQDVTEKRQEEKQQKCGALFIGSL